MTITINKVIIQKSKKAKTLKTDGSIIDNTLYTKLVFNSPQGLTIEMYQNGWDIFGGKGSAPLWYMNLEIHRLFAEGTEVLLEGEIVDKDGHGFIGQYNMLTSKLKRI